MQIVYLNFDVQYCLLVYPSPKPSTGDDLSSEEYGTPEVQNCAGCVNITGLLTVIVILGGGLNLGLFYCSVIDTELLPQDFSPFDAFGSKHL